MVKGRQEKYILNIQEIIITVTIKKMNVQIFLKTNDINKVLKSAF